MVDPTDPRTLIAGGLAVLGSKDILTKLLGPTADYVGGEVKGFVQKCNINLDRIFVIAAKKLGERLNSKGTVNARVLKHIVDEGRFCEDELTAEYYGGILASARSENGRDDRGVSLLAVLKDLSVYQIRFHFICYRIFSDLYHGAGFNLGDGVECSKMSTFMPADVFEKAMDFVPAENVGNITSHVLLGLKKHMLLEQCMAGNPEFLKDRNVNVDIGGLLFAPTLAGAELFLWALGFTDASGRELLHCQVSGQPDGGEVIIPEGSISVEKLHSKPPIKAAK